MATAQQTKSKTTDRPSADFPSVEAAGQRVREFNERLIESSKKAGLVTIDAYEKTLRSLADFEERVAGASRVEWVSKVATTHAKFVSDVSGTYTTAARDLLK